tara:strand:- start:316 stop:1209 length:894 start_codon:yes stop_codon:yes gene_type:complete
MQTEAVESYFGWINERHAIYQRRVAGKNPPWTDDPILQTYKFTNPFRENDRVTIWMRQNWTKPNENKATWGDMFFNCCLFRMVGTTEFAEEHGWVTDWKPEQTKALIQQRLADKKRTFTGAYIITNQGLKCSKAEVVVDHFLTPLWQDKEWFGKMASVEKSLQATHERLKEYRGWGGGGFMSYEVVTDLNYTPVLWGSEDRYTWANAGPGAVRGLNRIHGRELKKSMKQPQANEEMLQLLVHAGAHIGVHINICDVDMRTIEHSLCEWDKYERVRLGQGRPRSLFKPLSTTSWGTVA